MEGTVYYSDLLIVGSGIAGLRAACSAAEKGVSVIVISEGQGASPGIMGLNAPVGPDDSPEIYFNDSSICGSLLNDRALTEILVGEVAAEVAYLEKIGLPFDRNEAGGFDLLQVLGASRARLVHYRALTGRTALKVLKEEALKGGVSFQQPVVATGLLSDNGTVCGAVGLSGTTGELLAYMAKAVVLANGGCGGIYPVSQYPGDIVGGGYRAAFQAGAELIDMEFMQFDPCSFVYPKKLVGCSIPTTMLMEGAELRNIDGEIFVRAHDEHGRRIHKDGLSRAISLEIASGKGTPSGGVYYDVSMLPRERVVVDHSIFYEPALEAGVDLTKEPAEVAPAAHSSLGGVRINERCESSLPGLYAAGEVSGGLHGANRMGGSAGAETVVFGARAGSFAAGYARRCKDFISSEKAAALLKAEQELLAQRSLQNKGSLNLAEAVALFHEAIAGRLNIVKDHDGITGASERLGELEKALPSVAVNDFRELIGLYKLEGMITAARIIARAALARTESRGVHYRADYPERNDGQWLKNIIIRRSEEEITCEYRAVKK